ncbi:MAG: tetratricopeptide repeat protein [Candidatus Eremiobacteraeota bacterium]|nr:tetratricopeptide repeat protein [Candidatus Eremiobacteraeota bacterium]
MNLRHTWILILVIPLLISCQHRAPAPSGYGMPQDTIKTYLSFARQYVQDDRLEQAITMLRRAAKLNTKDESPLVALGIILLENDKTDLAIKELKSALERNPDSPTVHEYLGAAYLAKNQKKKALKSLKKCLSLSPDRPHARLLLGRLYLAENKYDLAGAELTRVIDLDPENLDACLGLVEISIIKKDFPKIKELLKTARKINREKVKKGLLSDRGEMAIIHLLTARALAEEGKLEQAETELNSALQIDPNLPDAYTLKGEIEKHKKNYPDARAALLKANKLAPDNPDRLVTLSEVLLEEGNLENARKHCSSALKENPTSESALLTMSEINLLEKKYDQAKSNLIKLLKVHPDSAAAHYRLASILQFRGDRQNALKHLEKAISLDKSYRNEIMNNDIFKPLTGHPEFDKIIGTVK